MSYKRFVFKPEPELPTSLRPGDRVQCINDRTPNETSRLILGNVYEVSWAEVQPTILPVVSLTDFPKTHLYGAWRFRLIERLSA